MPRVTIPSLLYDKPFYEREDYDVTTRKELEQHKRVPINYVQKGPNRFKQIAKNTLSALVVPILLHNLAHTLMGYVLMPSSRFSKSRVMKSRRAAIINDTEFVYKRITIKTKRGERVDAFMVGTKESLKNRKWIIESIGNQGNYESKFAKKVDGQIVLDTQTKRLARETGSNILLFNYPGVSKSSGKPSLKASRDAFDAALSCLEDKENGIGATHIIGFGHSIGGGVQGEALRKHKLKEDIQYVFIKSRSFSDMSTTVSTLKKSKLLGVAVKLFKWDLNSEKSSNKLQAPEIILQTANVKEYTIIDESMQKEIINRAEEMKKKKKKGEKGGEKVEGLQFVGDNMISEKASLAYNLITNGKEKAAKKHFIAIPDNHDQDLTNLKFLVEKIEEVRKEHYGE